MMNYSYTNSLACIRIKVDLIFLPAISRCVITAYLIICSAAVGRNIYTEHFCVIIAGVSRCIEGKQILLIAVKRHLREIKPVIGRQRHAGIADI